ncbi:MAG: MarR family transcriptional regulator [Thermoanaerobaculia bacterium]
MSPKSRLQQELKQRKPFASPSHEAAVALLRTADLVRRAVASIVEPHGITTQQYNVLRILRGAGDSGLPTLEIAERMIEQTPGITRLIDRLEAKGLVTRERCPSDRRQVFCRITAGGLELLAATDQPVLDRDTEALATLNDTEVVMLVDLLDRTRDALHATLPAPRTNPKEKKEKS